tara:strand:- start:108 stop:302 length:195 start_codon:yes stop_codon:yes gene_type:complete
MDKLKYKKVNHPEIAEQSGLSGILRTVDIEGKNDNAFIPLDKLNKDYQEYLAWVALGNEADPAD